MITTPTACIQAEKENVAKVVLMPGDPLRAKYLSLIHISTSDVEQYALISNVALGFIAFTIGNEFRLSQLKNIGRQAMIVGIAEGLVASLCVNVAMFVLHMVLGDKLPITTAITLGAIATATAPAATLMVSCV